MTVRLKGKHPSGKPAEIPVGRSERFGCFALLIGTQSCLSSSGAAEPQPQTHFGQNECDGTAESLLPPPLCQLNHPVHHRDSPPVIQCHHHQHCLIRFPSISFITTPFLWGEVALVYFHCKKKKTIKIPTERHLWETPCFSVAADGSRVHREERRDEWLHRHRSPAARSWFRGSNSAGGKSLGWVGAG